MHGCHQISFSNESIWTSKLSHYKIISLNKFKVCKHFYCIKINIYKYSYKYTMNVYSKAFSA